MIKAISDETRLRILNLLRKGKLCVCEIEEILEISQSNASRHLHRLANAKLINSSKRAQYVYYQLNDDIIKKHPFIEEILNKELIKEKLYIRDLEKLKKYQSSGLSCAKLKDKCETI